MTQPPGGGGHPAPNITSITSITSMTSLAADRFAQQYPPRPAIQSQHSSSVPSTPFQQPRDLRYHSRSPSPHRGLSNQSPRSVVSEAVGLHGMPQQGPPQICKFETGAEFRKRRIPYTEGGEQELGPPKKEPKKTLEPHEEEKLSGDMRELYDRLLPSEESEERRRKLVRKLEKMLNDEWPGNDIRVNVFGSSGNLLSSSDSDVDICITTGFQGVQDMHALAALLHRYGMQRVVCRASAKVPIVKCWDPDLQLAADLNVNNTGALENTRMIKTYVQLDHRIRPLAKVIKYWTKRRILNDAAFGGTISSYTWICMILSFLQRRTPPIIPSLQKTSGRRLSHGGAKRSDFADDLDALQGCGDANKESMAQLLFQFFRHYGYEFDYSRYVVSVREGRLVSRTEKGWDPKINANDKESHRRLCVEEPFTPARNLGNSADEYSWSGVHAEIRRAFDLLADGQQLDKCCEQYEFPAEERPIFQKPAPRPMPTLRRSASQSGRPNGQENPSGRSRKNNRNQSAQRAGNRRASSGAAFGNPRMPLQSPPLGVGGITPLDYFGARSNMHEYLSHQYQLLQAQRDALTAQLQQQQAQVQNHGQPLGSRVGDLAGSPLHRGGAFQNGLASPRFLDNPPQTAPLLPGYLYHYPAPYPPQSPMSQARTREGTNTNPSSPSLVAAAPVLRRQVHRASVTDGSSSSARSQSQPGRSLPHPLAMQQQAHPGYDVSGAIPAQYHQNLRSGQLYNTRQGGLGMPYSPLPGLPTSMESALPKEYMGYVVGSPSIGPQQYATAPPQMAVPTMTLRNPPPQRSRKVTPDLQPPVLNGRHSSRSPSPMSHLRTYSNATDMRASEMLQNPTAYDPPPALSDAETGGPLIVNGSTPIAPSSPKERNHSMPTPPLSDLPNGAFDQHNHNTISRMRSLPLRTAGLGPDPSTTYPATDENRPSSPRKASPNSQRGAKPGRHLTFSPDGASQPSNGLPEAFQDPPLPVTAPLLSPVAELRTPSPTSAQGFEKQESPQANGGLFMAAQIANAAKHVENNGPESPRYAKHERQGSAPNSRGPVSTNAGSGSNGVAAGPGSGGATTTVGGGKTTESNPWQQVAGKGKGHKKSKSTATSVDGGSARGQAMPVDERERKGG